MSNRVCAFCGAELEDDDRFCYECGAEIKKITRTTSAPRTTNTTGTAGTAGIKKPAAEKVNYPGNGGYAAQPSEYPMKWYKYIIYAYLFISAVGNLGLGMRYLTGDMFSSSGGDDALYALYARFSGLQTLNICAGIACIALAAFCIVVRQKLVKYKKEGPLWFLILGCASAAVYFVYLLVLTNICQGIDASVSLSDVMGADTSTTSLLVAVVIHTVLNKIYFDKRKALFVN